MEITDTDVNKSLGELPDAKIHCWFQPRCRGATLLAIQDYLSRSHEQDTNIPIKGESSRVKVDDPVSIDSLYSYT